MPGHARVIPALLLLGMATASTANAEPTGSGEDITNPENRFDIRMQFKSLPDASNGGRTFDDLSDETLTFRTDFLWGENPDQFALRVDLPFVWSNKPTDDNPDGSTESGTGDLLLQGMFVRTIDSRWAVAAGLQTILPTATGDAFGKGKWQLLPSFAFRADLPEIREGSYTGLIVRYDGSVAGDSSRSNINDMIFEPQLDIALPQRWFVNFSPKIRFDIQTADWFVPLDVMVGKRIGSRWIASLEYQYGLVRQLDSYNKWLEARLGYFF